MYDREHKYFCSGQYLKWVLVFSGILLFVFCYHTTIQWLIATWSHDKPYSHGFFVPFIFLYLVWLKREQLSRILPRPAWLTGGLILCVSSLLLLLGRTGAIVQLEVSSLYVFIFGVILLVWGWQTLKALWFPVLYLQFMIPWIDPLLGYVYPFFRRVAATLGTWFLSFKYPVMQDGTFIYLPDISLSVASACSGVNFFISVTAVGLLLAYLTQKSWKRVGLVVIAGGAVTILANGIRVALAGTMGQEYGAGMLHGPGHIFRGWFVAQVGWVGIFFINWMIARIPHPSTLHLYERWRGQSDMSATKVEPINREAARIPMVVLVVFLACFGGYLNFFALPRHADLSADLSTVPLNIGEWKGRAVTWLEGKQYFPGVNQEIVRNYRTPSGRSVYLYVGYFTHQAVDARLVSYHARPLFKNSRKGDLEAGDNEPLKVNLSAPVISSVPYKVLSWYQFIDGELADARKVKFKGVIDALVHHRNNGAIILVALPVVRSETYGVIPGDLAAFARQVAPILQSIIKGSRMGST